MIDFSAERPFVVFVAMCLTLSVSYAGSRLATQSDFLLDSPNERSSHHRDTPRAGGLAILAAVAAGLFIIAVFGGAREFSEPIWNMLLIAILAGGLGFADDRADLSPSLKFLGQVLIAFMFVWILGPLLAAPLPLAGVTLLGAMGAMGAVVAIFWIVAFMNVFNFMDGVNGLAAGSAATGLALFALIAFNLGAPIAGIMALVVAVGAAGYMPPNVLGGKVFMGDCGSHLLAFMIAGLAVFAAEESSGRVNALIMPTIFLPFIFDVGFTLTHRLVRRQNIVVAHREHLYQLILREGASHGTVAAFYAALVGFSAAIAILMLAIPPAYMFLAPVFLCALFFIGALSIYGRAKATGRLAPDGPRLRNSRQRRYNQLRQRSIE